MKADGGMPGMSTGHLSTSITIPFSRMNGPHDHRYGFLLNSIVSLVKGACHSPTALTAYIMHVRFAAISVPLHSCPDQEVMLSKLSAFRSSARSGFDVLSNQNRFRQFRRVHGRKEPCACRSHVPGIRYAPRVPSSRGDYLGGTRSRRACGRPNNNLDYAPVVALCSRRRSVL